MERTKRRAGHARIGHAHADIASGTQKERAGWAKAQKKRKAEKKFETTAENNNSKTSVMRLHDTDLPRLGNTKSRTRHKQNIKEVATAQPTRCGVKQGSATHEGGPFGGERPPQEPRRKRTRSHRLACVWQPATMCQTWHTRPVLATNVATTWGRFKFMTWPVPPCPAPTCLARRRKAWRTEKRLVPSLLGSIQRTVFQTCCIRANARMHFFL